MITKLTIENYAIIEHVEIDFNSGTTVITGETGAGKSIIIDALDLALGSRASKDKIRTGCDEAKIEVVFKVKQDDDLALFLESEKIPYRNELKINRLISKDNKSLAYINDQTVTNSLLERVTKHLINIFGQHDNQALLNEKNHLELLDNLGSGSFKELKEETKKAYQQYEDKKKELVQLEAKEELKERELDLLKYQRNEIESMSLDKINEEELMNDYNKFTHAHQLIDSYHNLEQNLSDDGQNVSILSLLRHLIQQISPTISYDESLKKLSERLNSVLYELEDIRYSAINELNHLDFNEESLYETEKSLNELQRLKSKYGNTINDILLYLDEVKDKITFYENFEEHLKESRLEKNKLKKNFLVKAEKLREVRKEIALSLEEKLTKELLDLNINNAKFKVFFSEHTMTETGIDQIEFYISTNVGEDLKPLVDIASGGEASRIMLAFKKIIAEKEEIETLIFDEVDTGISGETARIVATKLEEIGKDRQVIIISHLPQVVSISEYHLQVTKHVIKGKTKATVKKLSLEERTKALAKLIAGENYTDKTYQTAKDLLNYK